MCMYTCIQVEEWGGEGKGRRGIERKEEEGIEGKRKSGRGSRKLNMGSGWSLLTSEAKMNELLLG